LTAILLLGVFVAAGSFAIGAGLSKRAGCLLPPLLLIAIPFLIGCLIAFPLAPIVHVPLGLVMAWLGWRSRHEDFGRFARRSPGGWIATAPGWDTWNWSNPGGHSGWTGGGFSGGGSSWGGFSGGGSGGGGASGGW
jgi:hypothetical protein